jgi:hypothetical protein
VSQEQPASVESSPEFPFSWPDDVAAKLHWRRQTARGPLRPLQLDMALARQRTRANASFLTGAEHSGLTLAVNGQVYAAQVPSPLSAAERHAEKMAFERAATALAERGETYLKEALFPELDETNARLSAVDVD